MKNYKKFLTFVSTLILLVLCMLPSGRVYASLENELQMIPAHDGWNPLVSVFRNMQASPDGRFFSYIEYSGNHIAFGSEAYGEVRDFTYRHVIFDRISRFFSFGPEIQLTERLVNIAALSLWAPVTNSGSVYFSVPENASLSPGVYRLDSGVGTYQPVLSGYTFIFSISDNNQYALLSKSGVESAIDDAIYVFDLNSQEEYSVAFTETLKLDFSSGFKISDIGTLILKGSELYLANPVQGEYRKVAELMGGVGSVGNGAMMSADGQFIIARKEVNEQTFLLVKNLINGEIFDYSMSDLNISVGQSGYPLDMSNMGYGLSVMVTVGVNGNLYFQTDIPLGSDNVELHFTTFNYEQGLVVHDEVITSSAGGRVYIPLVSNSQSDANFYMGAVIDSNDDLTDINIYYRSEASWALKVVPENTVIDTYYSPQFSLDIKTLGEHYAVDASCTLNGPAALTSVSYGNWGSANRLQLPLQWQGQSLSGALSQTAPDAAVDGEQTLFNTVVLAEMTTDTLAVNCSGEMSDANGHLLSVMPDTITITLDDGIHGGNSAVNGQIVLPDGVSAEDVVVNITIDGRTISVTPDENGNFSFSGLRAGDFTVDFQSEGYVQSCMSATLDGAGNHDFGQIELLAGDINQDGAIDIADFTFLSGRYGTQQGEENYVATADLNKDTVINVQDLAILASHFGSQQCNP